MQVSLLGSRRAGHLVRIERWAETCRTTFGDLPIRAYAALVDVVRASDRHLFLLALGLRRQNVFRLDLSVQQSRILQRFDVGQVAQRLHAEG